MRSIFLKIFLWFWLAMALVGGTFFMVAHIIIHTNNDLPPPHEDFIVQSLHLYGTTALKMLASPDKNSFKDYLLNLETLLPVKVSIYQGQNQLIYGAGVKNFSLPPPPASSATKRTRPDVHFENENLLLNESLWDTNNQEYRFFWVVKVHRPKGLALGYQLVRFLAAFLAAGLLCYGLSRYLTSPIIKLSTATRQLASGDWQARVGSLVGNRKDELASLARDFDNMADRFCALIELQNRLISDISHELRSPLARLNVALSLAKKRAGEKAASALDRIELESDRLNGLIEQLLTLARLELPKEQLVYQPIDLTELIDAVAEDAEYEAQNRPCQVETKLAKVSMVGDEMLLRSAVDNVLRNAVRHAPPTTTVTVELDYQTVEGTSYAAITVRDQGQGVPESALNEIFRPFYRVEDARERSNGGTGLGLAIVAQAVKQHKGKVWATNIPAGGLAIHILLPIQPTNS